MNTGGSTFALVILLLTVVLFGSRSDLASAGSSEADTASLKGKLIRYDELKHQRVRQDGDVPAALTALDYEKDELPFVHVEDFNGDGVSDFMLGTPNGRLCGTAGCPYSLIDGRSLKNIGDFFGTVAVLKKRINRFPVVQTVSRRDVAATNLHTFVYDGRTYRVVSHALLDARGIVEWHRSLSE